MEWIDLDGYRNNPTALDRSVPGNGGATEPIADESTPAVIDMRPEPTREESFDRLTGLPDRASSIERIEGLPRGSTLIVFGLDRLTQLNEEKGRLAGDRVLRLFAAVSRDVVRRGDLIGRLQSDVFVCAMRDGGMVAIEAVLQRLRRTWRSDLPTFSAGSTRIGAEPPFQALVRAEKALRYAKAEGRNCDVHLPAPAPQEHPLDDLRHDPHPDPSHADGT